VLHAPALKLGINVIAMDRPGSGLSARALGHELLNWPGDVLELAGALGIHRFAVLGFSAGGPYALAGAWSIPERLSAVGVISGVGPFHSSAYLRRVPLIPMLLAEAGMRTPRLVHWLLYLAARYFKGRMQTPAWVTRLVAAPADKRVLDDEAAREWLTASVREAFRPGRDGVVAEGLRLLRQCGVSRWCKLRSLSIFGTVSRIAARLRHWGATNPRPFHPARPHSCQTKVTSRVAKPYRDYSRDNN
jgi:pimeloyl-ACP methyl ester carboxylesterase